MKIVKKFIKNQKGKVIKRKMPFTGEVNFYLKINSDFKNLYSFFCLSNDDFSPSMHISLEPLKGEYSILMGRYNSHISKWFHQKSNIKLNLNKNYQIQIFYGEKRNKIFVDDICDDEFFESEDMSFKQEDGTQITFGDVNNLIDESPISIDKFQVRDIYGKQKNSYIINVPKPEILDFKNIRIFN